MLIKSTQKPVKRRVTLTLNGDQWIRLKRLKEKAAAAGYELAMEDNLSRHLANQICRAEHDLAIHNGLFHSDRKPN